MREKIVAVAREWIDTPFHHLERQKGKAVDCAGLLIGVARECGLVSSTFDVPPYDRTPDGTLLKWCDRYMKRTTFKAMQAGDVVVISTDEDPQHLCILANDKRGKGFSIIHSSNAVQLRRVVETHLMFRKNFRFVVAYIFPGVD